MPSSSRDVNPADPFLPFTRLVGAAAGAAAGAADGRCASRAATRTARPLDLQTIPARGQPAGMPTSRP